MSLGVLLFVLGLQLIVWSLGQFRTYGPLFIGFWLVNLLALWLS